MSISASINIQLASYNTTPITTIMIIQTLLAAGWSLNDYGKTSYLPFGDNEMFNWVRETINLESLIEILKKKEAYKELIGIIITWQNTNVGGELLIWNNGQISFGLSTNRKILTEELKFTVTDINWYLTKLLPPLNQNILRVKSFSYEEHE